jgi:hypothetical protein
MDRLPMLALAAFVVASALWSVLLRRAFRMPA